MSAAVVEPFSVPEMRTLVVAVTALVPIVNVAVVWPAGTLTLAGTVAGTVPVPPLENDVESATTAPPDGAGAESVTVPLAAEPPTVLIGLIATALMAAAPPGVMSSNADCPGLPGRSAKTFMLNCDETAEVVMVNDAVVAPAGMVTDAGICATVDGAGVDSATVVAPPCGALSVTVPIA